MIRIITYFLRRILPEKYSALIGVVLIITILIAAIAYSIFVK